MPSRVGRPSTAWGRPFAAPRALLYTFSTHTDDLTNTSDKFSIRPDSIRRPSSIRRSKLISLLASSKLHRTAIQLPRTVD